MRRKDILKGLSFCITGKTFEKTQAEMAEVIKSYGGRVTNTVSSNTDYLIWGIQIAKNIKGRRSRNEKLALMYEVPVMKFEELLEEIKDNKGKRLREAAKMRRNSKI
ncbi:BRCT domain-containing protein [Lactobacillus taiwanensis]|uniref:BRCT domain-containing protein n=1 Tax=Lactobacillus taiwanensis TaxID=508451 RepID=UPI0025A968C5|nr:BRCT domain-containing protein [Lactobacillus taiwanensis]